MKNFVRKLILTSAAIGLVASVIPPHQSHAEPAQIKDGVMAWACGDKGLLPPPGYVSETWEPPWNGTFCGIFYSEPRQGPFRVEVLGYHGRLLRVQLDVNFFFPEYGHQYRDLWMRA